MILNLKKKLLQNCNKTTLKNKPLYFQYVTEFAVIINNLVGGKSKVISTPAVEDDPQRRKPDITRAMTYLHWIPKVYLMII